MSLAVYFFSVGSYAREFSGRQEFSFVYEVRTRAEVVMAGSPSQDTPTRG